MTDGPHIPFSFRCGSEGLEVYIFSFNIEKKILRKDNRNLRVRFSCVMKWVLSTMSEIMGGGLFISWPMLWQDNM